MLLELTGIPHSDCWFSPVVACPTQKDDPDDWRQTELMPLPKVQAMKACRSRLHQEIHLVQPEIVITCGAVAMRALWTTKPPDFTPNLGKMLDVHIVGDASKYAMPVLVIQSLSTLFREPADGPDRLWPKALQHLNLGKKTVEVLLEMRNGT